MLSVGERWGMEKGWLVATSLMRKAGKVVVVGGKLGMFVVWTDTHASNFCGSDGDFFDVVDFLYFCL